MSWQSGANNLLLKAGSLKLGLRGLILEKKSYFWAEICHSVVDWPGRARMKYWEPWLFLRELLYRLSLHFRISPFLLSQHCNCIRTAGKVLLCTIDFHSIARKTEGPRAVQGLKHTYVVKNTSSEMINCLDFVLPKPFQAFRDHINTFCLS